MSSFNPLLGTFDSLDDLFESILRLHVHQDAVPGLSEHWAACHYPAVPGAYPLAGLPGAVEQGAALFVIPKPFVGAALQAKCQNSVIGGFRIVRSAELLKHGLLPVYGFDFHRFVSVLVAFVPATEHDRFNPGGK